MLCERLDMLKRYAVESPHSLEGGDWPEHLEQCPACHETWRGLDRSLSVFCAVEGDGGGYDGMGPSWEAMEARLAREVSIAAARNRRFPMMRMLAAASVLLVATGVYLSLPQRMDGVRPRGQGFAVIPAEASPVRTVASVAGAEAESPRRAERIRGLRVHQLGPATVLPHAWYLRQPRYAPLSVTASPQVESGPGHIPLKLFRTMQRKRFLVQGLKERQMTSLAKESGEAIVPVSTAVSSQALTQGIPSISVTPVRFSGLNAFAR